jgi:hypothetical protein
MELYSCMFSISVFILFISVLFSKEHFSEIAEHNDEFLELPFNEIKQLLSSGT